jgi:hypothetical protein
VADKSEWHGWSRSREPYTGRSLHIGPLPRRKSICLYTMDYRDGAVMHVHAYFRSEEEARCALATLDFLLGDNNAA